jgi:hypothetical protein
LEEIENVGRGFDGTSDYLSIESSDFELEGDMSFLIRAYAEELYDHNQYLLNSDQVIII